MSIRYRIHKNLQIVHTEISRDFNTSDLRIYSEHIRHDPNFDGTFDHLIEFSLADPSEIGTLPAQVLSHLVPPVPHVQIAVVAPAESDFGIASRFQSIYGLPDNVFAVFRSRSEALEWFGMEEHQPEWGRWRTVSPDAPRMSL